MVTRLVDGQDIVIGDALIAQRWPGGKSGRVKKTAEHTQHDAQDNGKTAQGLVVMAGQGHTDGHSKCQPATGIETRFFSFFFKES